MEESFFIAQQQGISPEVNPEGFGEIFNSILKEKIHKAIVVSAAQKDTSIVVSYDDIDKTLSKRIDYFIQQVGSIENLEKEMGLSLEEIKGRFWDEIKNELLIEGFQRSLFGDIYVTRKEVFSFFETNKKNIPKTPSTSSFSLIEKKTTPSLETLNLVFSRVLEVRDSISSGFLSFEKAALRFSDDPSVVTNKGKMTTERGDLVSEYEKVAFSLSINEISLPVKTLYGYHLIKLLDRIGEKITSQHILFGLTPSSEDVFLVRSSFDSLKNKTINDPGLFDSLAYSYKTNKEGLSGVYNKTNIKGFPERVSSSFFSLKDFSFSDVLFQDDVFFIIYRYSFVEEKENSLEEGWFLIENLALENKREKLFNKWIDEQYDKTYVKINSFY